jgi:cobalt-zinc-cadmium efflux system protein
VSEHPHYVSPPPAQAGRAPAGGALGAALLLTFGFALIEAVAGWWSGSLALLSDAGHMITDSAALGFAALAAWVARRPLSARYSYGLGRAEVLVALGNGMFMLLLVAGIGYVAVQRFFTPQPVAGGMVALIAAAGLIVNLIVARILIRGAQTLNTRAALLHVMGDALGSVAALAAGVVILLTGWTPIDPLLSLLICALILYSSFNLLREALHVLMEGVPPGVDLPEVGRSMAATPGVLSVDDLHIWTLSSGLALLSAHVRVRDLSNWEHVLHELRELLRERYGIEHVTLQPEPATQAASRQGGHA